jgi:hypothetical protein
VSPASLQPWPISRSKRYVATRTEAHHRCQSAGQTRATTALPPKDTHAQGTVFVEATYKGGGVGRASTVQSERCGGALGADAS